jgi:hypothetical protein
MDGSRRASVHTAHGFCVSILPHTRQISIFSIADCKAEASGAISNSRFLMRNNAARRAERGPSPGSRANSWIRRSISGPAAMEGMRDQLHPLGLLAMILERRRVKFNDASIRNHIRHRDVVSGAGLLCRQRLSTVSEI